MMPMSHVARALETDETRGLMKAVVDARTEQILGFTMLGIEGGEIMSAVQLAIQGRLTAAALRRYPGAPGADPGAVGGQSESTSVQEAEEDMAF